MTTTPTSTPVPSESPRDLKFNAGKIDEFVTSENNVYVDRLGNKHRTIQGINNDANQAILNYGYITLDSFEDGNTLTLPNQVLRLESTGEYYRWDGSFPKIVQAGSTPESTGGIGVGKWLSVGDAAFREEANKKYKYSVKLSDYITLQEAASAAVDGLLIDREYNFTDNETIDFGGKVLTINFQESFVADGSIIFTNLGEGSVINNPDLKSATTPYVINRFDSNGNWLDSASVLTGLSQRRDKGYQPTVNDIDIWSSLSTAVQNQNVYCELVLGADCSGVTVNNPTGEFAIIRVDMSDNVEIKNPRMLGGKGATGTIVFVHLGDTGYGTGNRVVGGQINYGSFSPVVFIRQKGYAGGVSNFTAYRCGESGVKTYQNEIGGRSARCYELTFEDIKTIQSFYDGVDFNADYGNVTSRSDDYPVSTYPSRQLPTKHRIRNILTIDCKGVGAWWDGQGIYAENVITKDGHKTGIWDLGTNNILVNMTVIGCNSDNGTYNHLTCEGSNQIIGASVTVYSGIDGYAIYAPGSQASNLYTNKGLGAGAVLLTSINNSRLGNTEVTSQTDTATLRMRPSAYLVTNDGVKIDAVTQVSTPGSESASLTISPVQGGTYGKGMSLNVGGTGQLVIPAAGQLLGDVALSQNGTLAFYLESGILKIIYRREDGTFNRVTIG